MISKLKVYVYSCDTHPVGSPVRRMEAPERDALARFAVVVRHATSCWVMGCQLAATQVRLAEVLA